MIRSAEPTPEALPNPRGAAVPVAERALAEARHAFDERAALGAPLLCAAQALGQAGWLPAQRFADMLVLASAFADGELAGPFGAALEQFEAALGRRNLREFSCSRTLFARYSELNAYIAARTGASSVAYEDFALAGRPIAPATMQRLPLPRLARVRACYEEALLALLRDPRALGALDALERCSAELAGPDSYDVWRLASACARALRLSAGATSADDELKRFYARCNLLLADQARGAAVAPRSFVRSALALLWRDYALYGAAAEDADHVEVLNDYGLTVDWHVAGTSASEAAWEAGAAVAEQAALRADGAGVREFGVLSMSAPAYEDFLQTAEAAMSGLSAHGVADTAEGARHASDAAYRLGAAACAIGLGHIATLSDALGLAWRLTSCALQVADPARAPERQAVADAGEALRGMLLRVAAGIVPPEPGKALAGLSPAIERAVPASTAPPSS